MSFGTGQFYRKIFLACLVAVGPARLSAQMDSTDTDFWSAARPTITPATQSEIDQTAALLRLMPLPDTGRFDCPSPDGFSQNGIVEGVKNSLATAQKLVLLGRLDCATAFLDQLLNKIPADQTGLRAEVLSEKLHALLRFRENETARPVALALRGLIEKGHRPSGRERLGLAQFDHINHRSDAALISAQAVLAEARAGSDRPLEAQALSQIGRISRDVFFGSSGKALPYHYAALEIARSLGDTVLVAQELVNLSWNHGDMGDLPRHLDFMRQAAVLLQKTEDVRRKLGLIVQMASDFKTVDEGLEWHRLGRRIAIALHLPAITADSDMRLYSQLVSIGRLGEAEPYLRHAATIADDKNWGLTYELYDLYKRKNDPKQALFYLEKAYSTVSSDYMGRNAAAISEAETQFKTGEKERLLAENEQKRKQLVLLVGAVGLLLGAAAWLFFREKKTSRQLAQQRDVIERQAAGLRELDEVKSRFFANVSHELRTPLTLMLGPIGSMLKRGRIDGTDMALAQTAQQHGRQLLRLVSEILDLSKMDSGKLEMRETAVSFQPFVMRVLGAFESHAARLGVGFNIDYALGERLVLLVDEDKFRKIVNNYLSNAFKFTPAGGSVAVRVEEAGAAIRLSVADTGRGIHPEDLPKVFERFFQTAQPGAAAEGGTGIGLSLCRELAGLMGGRVWVESEVGRGSTFFFEFPKKEAVEAAEVASPLAIEEATAPVLVEKPAFPNGKQGLSNGKPSQPTVLVVEDNEALRDYLRLILSEKFRVETAANGRAALDFLQAETAKRTIQHSPFIIVSDVMMPVMDGFQLVERLKSDEALQKIPVVMLTARADLKDRLKALRIGVDDYLLKPFEEEEIVARLENLLKNAAARRFFSNEIEVQTDGAAEPDEGQTWLAELEKTVSSNIGQFDFNADQLAAEMAMGRTSFFNQVKKLTGLTPNQYVQEVRFGRAKWLLETGRERSVKAVAFAVGMRDVQYFSEQFKRRFGRSPGELLG